MITGPTWGYADIAFQARSKLLGCWGSNKSHQQERIHSRPYTQPAGPCFGSPPSPSCDAVISLSVMRHFAVVDRYALQHRSKRRFHHIHNSKNKLMKPAAACRQKRGCSIAHDKMGFLSCQPHPIIHGGKTWGDASELIAIKALDRWLRLSSPHILLEPLITWKRREPREWRLPHALLSCPTTVTLESPAAVCHGCNVMSLH